MKRLLLAICVAAGAAPALAVNKCTIDGQVVFQDGACPGKGELVADDIARKKAQQDLQRIEMAKVEADRVAAEQKRIKQCGTTAKDEPAIGMTTVQWQCTTFWDKHGWGSRVNETETASGKRRQHVFHNGSIKYIYTSNGVITAIQR